MLEKASDLWDVCWQLLRIGYDLPKRWLAGGMMSGAFVMMDVAIKERMSGEETVQKAKDLGFKCDVPRLEEFVENYVERQQKQPT